MSPQMKWKTEIRFTCTQGEEHPIMDAWINWIFVYSQNSIGSCTMRKFFCISIFIFPDQDCKIKPPWKWNHLLHVRMHLQFIVKDPISTAAEGKFVDFFSANKIWNFMWIASRWFTWTIEPYLIYYKESTKFENEPWQVMWFPTMWHFDKCRLRWASAASF